MIFLNCLLVSAHFLKLPRLCQFSLCTFINYSFFCGQFHLIYNVYILAALLSQIDCKIKRINYQSQNNRFMKSPLLPKGSNFAQTYQNLVLRVQSIKKKNDQYQRLNAEQIDAVMAQQILQEKSIMDRQVEQTRRIIEDMETAYREPMHKNKLKQTKRQYEKQLSRYKQVSQSLMEKSVIKAEMRNSTNKRNSLPNQNNRGSRDVFREVRPDRGSAQLAQQQQLDVDYDFEHHVIMERKKQLGKAQQQAHRINAVMKDMSQQVNDQGQKVDIIGEQMLKAHQNVEATNEQLISAASQQKKGCKKCYIILFIVVFLVVILLGTVFILQRNKNQ